MGWRIRSTPQLGARRLSFSFGPDLALLRSTRSKRLKADFGCVLQPFRVRSQKTSLYRIFGALWRFDLQGCCRSTSSAVSSSALGLSKDPRGFPCFEWSLVSGWSQYACSPLLSPDKADSRLKCFLWCRAFLTVCRLLPLPLSWHYHLSGEASSSQVFQTWLQDILREIRGNLASNLHKETRLGRL